MFFSSHRTLDSPTIRSRYSATMGAAASVSSQHVNTVLETPAQRVVPDCCYVPSQELQFHHNPCAMNRLEHFPTVPTTLNNTYDLAGKVENMGSVNAVNSILMQATSSNCSNEQMTSKINVLRDKALRFCQQLFEFSKGDDDCVSSDEAHEIFTECCESYGVTTEFRENLAAIAMAYREEAEAGDKSGGRRMNFAEIKKHILAAYEGIY